MGLRIEADLNKMSKNIFYEILKTLIFAVPKMSDNQLLDLLRMTWVVGSVVQLVRMPPCHGGGRGFESRPVRKSSEEIQGFLHLYGLILFASFKTSTQLICRPLLIQQVYAHQQHSLYSPLSCQFYASKSIF